MPRKKKQISRSRSWLAPFKDFIGHMVISSKELSADEPVPLLDIMYGAQHRFLEEVCEGLDRGIHSFVCLKARQLGISTISLAMDVFWLSVHDKMQGALVCDTEGNREKFRILLEQYIQSLPRTLRVGIKAHNRNNMVLENGSVLDYLVAGSKKGPSGLGKSRALNFIHATECSSWGSEEGVASLQASLAQKHPDRLYIWESTARGLNLFYDMYGDAETDDLTQKAFFIGWWAKEDYCFPVGSVEYDRYWDGELNDEEIELCSQVKQLYGHDITTGQVAWHRWMRTAKITSPDLMNQEYPWTADQAFIMTGKSFFPLRRITEDIKFIKEAETPLKAYRYHMGENFLATELEPLESTTEADLRIWEEPHPNGIYVMGVDPAFGRSDENDNHGIQVYRGFADKIVQCAEYATNSSETYQMAWVMAHLAGAYKNIWINLEVNGPGAAVMQELRHLRQLMDNGYLTETARERGMEDVFYAVKWYLYHRPDSMGAGYVYNWKTSGDNKMVILNQMRDSYALRMLKVRSIPLLEEMGRVVQDGAEIRAEGRSHDDRVFATALAHKAWMEWVRPGMIASNQTYDRELEHDRLMDESPQATFIGSVVSDFFRQQEAHRDQIEEEKAWGGVR